MSVNNHMHKPSSSQEDNSTLKVKSSCGCCASGSSHAFSTSKFKIWLPILISSFLLTISLILDQIIRGGGTHSVFITVLYFLAYIPVAYPVLKEAFNLLLNQKDFFNEFSLMSIATLGAFAIGEYPEAVAVMLLYAIGELLQSLAVGKATQNIESLLDLRVEEARVITPHGVDVMSPEDVKIGSRIQLRVGDKCPVDGFLLSESASFNTIALTGESVPYTVRKGEPVMSGMLNLEGVVEIESTKSCKDSALAKILELVQNATERKAKTELMIRKFARWYTPAVFALSLAVVILPYFFTSDYSFREWLYRALIFLVISCPCALVISIPLSYFGGIGAASRQGILFKGASYLDVMAKVDTVVVDKTGTMTEGVFEVQEVYFKKDRQQLLDLISAVESYSSHPIAQAVLKYHPAPVNLANELTELQELAGYGIKCLWQGRELLVGNHKLLEREGVKYDAQVDQITGTIVLISYDKEYLGALHISDKIKSDAKLAVRKLHSMGIKEVIMLSGDQDLVTQYIASKTNIDKAFGGLLPQDKVKKIEELKSSDRLVCFVGDGINDAPSLALSDVGVAMGTMGADIAIDVADVVIQTDQPSKIVLAIKIAKATRKTVFQNIALAFSIKFVVMLLGAVGVATMWEAVIADVGVTILAVLNAIRLLHNKRF